MSTAKATLLEADCSAYLRHALSTPNPNSKIALFGTSDIFATEMLQYSGISHQYKQNGSRARVSNYGRFFVKISQSKADYGFFCELRKPTNCIWMELTSQA